MAPVHLDLVTVLLRELTENMNIKHALTGSLLFDRAPLNLMMHEIMVALLILLCNCVVVFQHV